MAVTQIIVYIALFCIGTLFGSFFTLAVYRIPLKKDITHERSFCPNCNHKLTFLDMVPVLSYICLGGKCRYCKQKIRPRYLLLEILSGIVFVLFAMSVKLNVLESSVSTIVYFVFGILYLATLFIIAGIDKERTQIEKSVLLFGYIVETLYIVYLYIVEKDPNIYRYVIYLAIICILVIIDTVILRKKAKSSYPVDVLLLCMFQLTFTYQGVSFLTIIMTLLAVAFYILIQKIHNRKAKNNKVGDKLPIGFFLCISNIMMLLITNGYILGS